MGPLGRRGPLPGRLGGDDGSGSSSDVTGDEAAGAVAGAGSGSVSAAMLLPRVRGVEPGSVPEMAAAASTAAAAVAMWSGLGGEDAAGGEGGRWGGAGGSRSCSVSSGYIGGSSGSGGGSGGGSGSGCMDDGSNTPCHGGSGRERVLAQSTPAAAPPPDSANATNSSSSENDLAYLMGVDLNAVLTIQSADTGRLSVYVPYGVPLPFSIAPCGSSSSGSSNSSSSLCGVKAVDWMGQDLSHTVVAADITRVQEIQQNGQLVQVRLEVWWGDLVQVPQVRKCGVGGGAGVSVSWGWVDA